MMIIGTQAQNTPTVINAENVLKLRPMWQINFDELNMVTDDATPLPLVFSVGSFAMSDDGQYIVVGADTEDTPSLTYWVGFQLFSEETWHLPVESDFRPIDPFFDGGDFYWSELLAETFLLYTLSSDDPTTTSRVVKLEMNNALIDGWKQGDIVGLEALSSDYESVVILIDLVSGRATEAPYLPAEDEDAVVRIGRVPLPYVVTSSEEGIVKLWNLGTQEPLATVDNTTGEPSVFGNINNTPTHLVWRDNASLMLYLLDFATGENKAIDALNGAYVQWFFLTPNADVVIGVGVDGEPNVVAWDVANQTSHILGEYRTCGRPQPDMARLSRDGTTLVIGCGDGLEVWRVVD